MIQLHNLVHCYTLAYHQGCAFLSLFLATFAPIEDTCKIIWFLGGHAELQGYFQPQATGLGADCAVLYELAKLHLPELVEHLEIKGRISNADGFLIFFEREASIRTTNSSS